MDYADLDSFLHKDEMGAKEEAEKSKKALHKIPRPLLLRRVKTDVEKNLLPSMFRSLFVRFGGMLLIRGVCFLQRRRSISMLAWQRCSENGIARCWGRISTLLMVCRVVCLLLCISLFALHLQV